MSPPCSRLRRPHCSPRSCTNGRRGSRRFAPSFAGWASCFAPWLWRLVAERAATRPEGSYVAAVLEEGSAAAARKVGEEGLETALAGTSESNERVISELADLWFHSYVLLAARGLDPADV